MLETLAITGITIAGQTIFGRVISDPYGLVKETTIHPAVNAALGKIDLEANLQVITALVKKVNTKNLQKDDPLAISLAQVDGMVHHIRDELKQIKVALEVDKDRWFMAIRTPSYKEPLRRLIHHKQLLDNRVKMLINLIQLNQN